MENMPAPCADGSSTGGSGPTLLAALLAELLARPAALSGSLRRPAQLERLVEQRAGTSPTRAGSATAPPSSRPSSAKIASPSGLSVVPRATRREALAQLQVAVGRVEDPPDDELRRRPPVPAVLLQPEGDVVAPDPPVAVELARPGRRRSRSRPGGRPAGTRKRRCLPSPTAARSPSSQPATRSVHARVAEPERREPLELGAEVERERLAPGTIASTVVDRREIVVGEVLVGVGGERLGEGVDALGPDREARRRRGGRRSARGARSRRASPPCRSKAGIERPEPFQSPRRPGDQDDRAVVALDEPRRDDPDHALVPVLAGDDVPAPAARVASGHSSTCGEASRRIRSSTACRSRLSSSSSRGEARGLVLVVGEEQLERGRRTARAGRRR